MATAADCKGTVCLLQQDLNHCGYLLGIAVLNEAFRRELRCQGPIRVDTLSIQGVIWHVDILEASIDEGLALLYNSSQK